MARMIINPADFGRIKRMKFRELNDYLYHLYSQGRSDAKEELCGGYPVAVVFTNEGMEERLKEIPWMDDDKLNDIFEAMYKDIDENDMEDKTNGQQL